MARENERRIPDPEQLGKPTFPHPVPLGDVPLDKIPPAAPGEQPDRSDDTAGVPLDTLTWLKSAKAVLLAEGFKREPLKQYRKAGQVWGVIRQEPDDLQTHVRAFKDGRLESEVELSNRYLQHFWSHRRSAHPEVKEILARHGMPTEQVSETFVPVTGSHPEKRMPTGRTKMWKVAVPVLVGIGLLLGRAYWRRAVMKRR
ncbi:MAG TPA: hypothetical protein VI796_03935 [Candidatus Thermoplasmatota archaeon]|nr:hypothetical protein [Candidatus Thermoplasmatota archaeon]